jgi:hypothetical protein
MTSPAPSAATWLPRCLPLAGMAALVLAGVWLLVLPQFGPYLPSIHPDSVAHVALVTAALETLQTTRALPISSDAIVPGVEYPYFLFGNAAFYVGSALISYALSLPAHVGMGVMTSTAFAAGFCGIVLLSRSAGLNVYVGGALGLLYAAGPYTSTDLYVRLAYPEYLAVQLPPLLLVLLRGALRSGAAPWTVLIGAIALVAPAYVHKPTAAYVILTLLALAASAAPWQMRTVGRLAVIGVVAVCLVIPVWYPSARGLDPDMVAALTGQGRPSVYNASASDLFWPFLHDSLAAHPGHYAYLGRFALQVGIMPTIGVLVAVWTLLTQPRLAIARHLIMPLVLFGLLVALILGYYDPWEVAPSPLRYIQFTYRLIGLAHFVGFVLLVEALGSPRLNLRRHSPPVLRRLLVVELFALGLTSLVTYWQPGPFSPTRATDIRPHQLPDISRFYPHAVDSTMRTGAAIDEEGWVSVPPRPIPVEAGARLILAGSVPPALFTASPEPVIVRLFGLPQSELLGEVPVTAPGSFELRVSVPSSSAAIRIDCSRSAPAAAAPSSAAPGKPVCMRVTYLAVPNEGGAFVSPREVPAERRTRLAFGSWRLEARDLEPTHYLLPTFYYPFVRVTASDGSSVPVYHFDRRAAIRHTAGVEWYTVTYGLEPEVLAFVAGLGFFAVYAVISTLGDPKTLLQRRALAGTPEMP